MKVGDRVIYKASYGLPGTIIDIRRLTFSGIYLKDKIDVKWDDAVTVRHGFSPDDLIVIFDGNDILKGLL